MYSSPKKLHYFSLSGINKIIKILILSDVIIIGASGLLGPIFAIFIEDFIVGANATVIGIAISIYLFTKSILQIPLARIIDKNKGEQDDFAYLFWGSIVMSLLPLLYLLINTPIQLYFVQFITGVVTAATFSSFMAIFTRHIDKNEEATEWGVYFTLTDFSSAGLAALGGYIATKFGFDILIYIMVVVSFIGAILIWPIRFYLRKINHRIVKMS